MTRNLVTEWLLTAIFPCLLTACSQEENDERLQPSAPADTVATADYTITVTTEASAPAATRSHISHEDGQYQVSFATGDKLLVWGTNSNDGYYYGELSLQKGAGTTAASFTGNITVEGSTTMTSLKDAKTLNALLAPTSWSSSGFTYNSTTHSYAHTQFTPVSQYTALADYLHIVSTAFDKSSGKITLDNAYSVIHATWSGMVASKTYTIHAYNNKNKETDYCGKTMTTDAQGTLDFYLPLTLTQGYYFMLEGTGETYTYDQTHNSCAYYKVYTLKRHFLDNITAQYTVSNGQTLTGTTNKGIIIPAGYTVSLDGATIVQGTNGNDYAPVTCLGDATIKIYGDNTMTSKSDRYPAVMAGPAKTTLTITGKGSLTATAPSTTNGAPGIGCQSYSGKVCGNIVISGGTVTAKGTSYSAAIGTGYSGTCGKITITEGVTKIVATKGASASQYNYIGKGGSSSTCDTVFIDGVKHATPLSTFTHFSSTLSSPTWTLTKK